MSRLSQSIVSSLKQNLVPGLILQAFAVSLVVLYFYVPSTEFIFNLFGTLKSQHGWIYAAIATSLFGGLIPCLYLQLTGQITSRILPVFLFYTLFWAYKGIEVDFMYLQQARWFGNNNELATIVKKVSVDQFIYGPLWAGPTMAIGYLWKESAFSFSLLIKRMDKEFLRIQIPTTIVTGWLIWVPAVSLIYSMPANLQIPLFNLVLCFFVLLLSSISRRSPSAR